MCGIVYIRGEKMGIVDKLIKHYKLQKSRGVEGFGFVMHNGASIVHKRAQKEHEIKDRLKKIDKKTTLDKVDIMFHHRYPTSTINLEETAHPIKVSNKELEYDYYVIHNGVISNCDTLKKQHEDLGYEYNTEIENYVQARYNSKKTYITGTEYNDSESLAIELARYCEGLNKDIEARGSIAFIMLQVEKHTEKPICLHYGRNDGNPLGWTIDGDHEILASEGVDKIASNMWFKYTYATGTTEVSDCEIGYYYVPTYGFTNGAYNSGYCGSDWKYGKDGKKYAHDDDDDYTGDYIDGAILDDDEQLSNAFDVIDEIEAFEDLYEHNELPKHWSDSIKYLDDLAMRANKAGNSSEEFEYRDYIESLKDKLEKYYLMEYQKEDQNTIPF